MCIPTTTATMTPAIRGIETLRLDPDLVPDFFPLAATATAWERVKRKAQTSGFMTREERGEQGQLQGRGSISFLSGWVYMGLALGRFDVNRDALRLRGELRSKSLGSFCSRFQTLGSVEIPRCL